MSTAPKFKQGDELKGWSGTHYWVRGFDPTTKEYSLFISYNSDFVVTSAQSVVEQFMTKVDHAKLDTR